ncbi:MAG: hypothetical protein IKD03_00420, partial [Clostridia bacterium]|nr:hypothetical protein [Clostridia bacterium]
RFVNRPYEMTKVGGNLGDGGSKPQPYEKIVYLVVLRNRLCLRWEQFSALRKDRIIWSYYRISAVLLPLSLWRRGYFILLLPIC